MSIEPDGWEGMDLREEVPLLFVIIVLVVTLCVYLKDFI